MDDKPLYDIKELAAKWIAGTITEHEKAYFDKWYNNFDFTKLEISGENTPEEIKERILQNLEEGIKTSEISHPIREKSTIPLWIKTIAAAAVLILISYGVYFSLNNQTSQKLTKTPAKHEIIPGGNKAILRLADGSEIILNNSENGVLVNQGSSVVNKTKEGQIIYDLKDTKSPTAENTQTVYNTIVTPRGGQYQIILQDGTKVWLNASSSLRFPTSFSGKSREVEITGEAYFEVAKNKDKPFFVRSSGQTIEVLGTHFNVNAYRDESSIKTTLLEGSVKVSVSSNDIIITPGQQSVVNRSSSTLTIRKADIKSAVSWKEGYFQFDNESIESIMRKVSRWYDVDIYYAKGYTQQGFVGSISRFEDVSKVLKMLELTETVHFKIEGRRITVMP